MRNPSLRGGTRIKRALPRAIKIHSTSMTSRADNLRTTTLVLRDTGRRSRRHPQRPRLRRAPLDRVKRMLSIRCSWILMTMYRTQVQPRQTLNRSLLYQHRSRRYGALLARKFRRLASRHNPRPHSSRETRTRTSTETQAIVYHLSPRSESKHH